MYVQKWLNVFVDQQHNLILHVQECTDAIKGSCNQHLSSHLTLGDTDVCIKNFNYNQCQTSLEQPSPVPSFNVGSHNERAYSFIFPTTFKSVEGGNHHLNTIQHTGFQRFVINYSNMLYRNDFVFLTLVSKQK